jgi:hypoxanthine phosphoribosyltransferase
MTDQRIEVSRLLPYPPQPIFSVLTDPWGHVRIDASGMLMSAQGDVVSAVGDVFIVQMDRDALNDIPLGKYYVHVRIVRFSPEREIAWTIEHPAIDPPMGYIYGYRLEPTDEGTLVTSYCDWSQVPPVHAERISFPVIPESSLRATLGILARSCRFQHPDSLTHEVRRWRRVRHIVGHRYDLFVSEREELSYEGFGRACRELAQTIADSGYRPDIILSIARGGFFLGAGLGYALGVKNAFMMSVEFYTGVDERLDMPVVLPPVPNRVDLSGAVVLIADDVADSGETLKTVTEFCADHVSEVRSAVLYEKPRSVITPDYAWRLTEKWINFPWSVEGPVVASSSAVRDA